MSMNFNCVGRFVKDPVLTNVGENAVKASFTLAVDEQVKSQGEMKTVAQFLDFEIWDKAAELIVKHKKKGDEILILRAIARKDTWEKDGEKRSKTYFRVNEFKLFLSSGKNENTAPKKQDQSTDDIPY